MRIMNNTKQVLLSKLQKQLPESLEFDQLYDCLLEEEVKLVSYKEAVCDIVEDYHNNKKELTTLIEELVIVLSATREYENCRASYTQVKEQLLWDTGTEVLVKALKLLNKQ